MEISTSRLRPQRATEYLCVESAPDAVPFSIERDVAPYWPQIKQAIREYAQVVLNNSSDWSIESIVPMLFWVHCLFPDRLRELHLPQGSIEKVREHAMSVLRQWEVNPEINPVPFIARQAIVDPLFRQ